MSVSIPGNREPFLQEAEKAFNKDLDSEVVLRSQILQRHHKLWENYRCPKCAAVLVEGPFLSNTKKAAARRGRARQRRLRKPTAVEEGDAGAGTDADTDNDWEAGFLSECPPSFARARVASAPPRLPSSRVEQC